MIASIVSTAERSESRENPPRADDEVADGDLLDRLDALGEQVRDEVPGDAAVVRGGKMVTPARSASPAKVSKIDEDPTRTIV